MLKSCCNDSILSIRIVSADYYMCKPHINFDPCYSEFRGSQIKQVPVIRIFGSTLHGIKTCMHVHSVFPYLYVPYDNSDASPDKVLYQIATSLDKAINISLGQTNAQTQHVFKVSLVKGIPFYGYHPKEHQFLKIYLYNPGFIKRVASLFQNGAILGKIFQSYESHVPYILQFFIDYNLYGMSFLHVPNDFTRQRRRSNNISQENSIDPISVSESEIDIVAQYILNRITCDTTPSSQHQNPGISAIWKDEQYRRDKIIDLGPNIPPLVIADSQERLYSKPTESDNFYKNCLASKIKQDEHSSISLEKTATILNQHLKNNKKFNLSTILGNTVYPSEVLPDTDKLLNASIIQNHKKEINSQNSFLQTTIIGDYSEGNMSFVDEDLVLTLSQKPLNINDSFSLEDLELLQVMKTLEEDNKEALDIDSLLAPLSQSSQNKVNQSQMQMILNNSETHEALEKNISLIAGDNSNESDSDDDMFKDLSVIFEDNYQNNDICNFNIKQQMSNFSDKFEQVDGANEVTPKKILSKRKPLNSQTSPKKENKRQKYTPLNITVLSSPKSNSSHSNDNELFTLCRKVDDIKKDLNIKRLKRNLSFEENKESGYISIDVKSPYLKSLIKPCSVRLNKPRKIFFENDCTPIRKTNIKDSLIQLDEKNNIKNTVPVVKIIRLKPLKFQYKFNVKPSLEVAKKYDFENNFFPEPGPSNINYYKSVNFSILRNNCKSNQNKSPVTKHNSRKISISSNESTDLNICSFYEKTFCMQSPSESQKSFGLNETIMPPMIIVPLTEPPSYDTVLNSLKLYDLPKVINQEPFYSDLKDITKRKEVGDNVLFIQQNQDQKDFVSLLPKLQLLKDYRQNISSQFSSSTIGGNFKNNLGKSPLVVISPLINPITYTEAKEWAKQRAHVNLKFYNDKQSNGEIKMNKIDIQASLLSPKEQKTILNGHKTINNNTVLNSSTNEVQSYSERKKKRPKRRVIKVHKRNKKCKSIDSLSSEKPITISDDSLNDILDVTDEESSVRNNNNSSFEIPNGLDMTLVKDYIYNSCEISGITLDNTYGFKMEIENFQKAKVNTEFNYLTILSIEIHVQTRGDLRPDPEFDPIIAIFYVLQNNVPEDYRLPTIYHGFIIVDAEIDNLKQYHTSLANSNILYNIQLAKSEKHLYELLVDLVKQWDPDILVGYEIEMSSWGYIIQRGNEILMNMSSILSRITSTKVIQPQIDVNDENSEYNDSGAETKLTGRILLDVWRLLRHEIALTSYTFENVMYHILQQRFQLLSFKDLSRLWFKLSTRWIVLQYFNERSKGTLDLLNQLDLIGRTCELAKLFGIQFYEVLSRGSQFRVESMMLRIAKPRNIIPLSPSVQQRAHMRAPEYIPLILEPQSRFYADPLIVLDFQSLYPSIIIAHNYCFSTCLGRVEHLGQDTAFEFGASYLKISTNHLKKLLEDDKISVAPCGVAFVKSEVRIGILPQMLKEILDTRLMVKESMKIHKDNKLLQRVLHSRQLGLKLIANVTYGYTAANFSGRMPCIEVGDSVVSKGRETLERAIKMVEANKNWKAKVVYGDTDSLFVLLPGRSKETAFIIGQEIANAVTADNPKPIKLKLEKVYYPSILQTKKRYVGFMYESANQKEAKYEAKGIETVRRDGCPAVAKILEKTLRILFETRDVSVVKSYICRQFSKILNGRINFQDLIFSKEFRGINGYKPGVCVPALIITKKMKKIDKRWEPRRGERVPFIIVNGPPGVTLIRLVRTPYELLADDGLKINANYYITKAIIPALNRCLCLIGADVSQWFQDMPRKSIHMITSAMQTDERHVPQNNAKKSTISQYFATTACPTECGNYTETGLCNDCKKSSQHTSIILCDKISKLERKYTQIKKICQSCCGRINEIQCISLDCPILFVLKRVEREFEQTYNLRNLLKTL